jgi:hypothetical protein
MNVVHEVLSSSIPSTEEEEKKETHLIFIDWKWSDELESKRKQ